MLAACKTLASIYGAISIQTILVQPERHGVIEDRMHGQVKEGSHEAEEDQRDLKQPDGNLTGGGERLCSHRRRKSERCVVINQASAMHRKYRPNHHPSWKRFTSVCLCGNQILRVVLRQLLCRLAARRS